MKPQDLLNIPTSTGMWKINYFLNQNAMNSEHVLLYPDEIEREMESWFEITTLSDGRGFREYCLPRAKTKEGYWTTCGRLVQDWSRIIPNWIKEV